MKFDDYDNQCSFIVYCEKLFNDGTGKNNKTKCSGKEKG